MLNICAWHRIEPKVSREKTAMYRGIYWIRETPRLSMSVVTGFGQLSPDTIAALCPCVGVTYFGAPGPRKYSTSTSAAAADYDESICEAFALENNWRDRLQSTNHRHFCGNELAAGRHTLSTSYRRREKQSRFLPWTYLWRVGRAEGRTVLLTELFYWRRLVVLFVGRYCLTTLVKLFGPLCLSEQGE